MLRKAAILLVLLLTGAGLALAQDGNWPGWRGDGTGISHETGLPVDFDADGEVLWTTELEGSGHSSPVVWGDRLYLTNAGGPGSSLLTEATLRWTLAGLGLLVVAAMLAAVVRSFRSGEPGADGAARGPAWFRGVAALERIGAMVVSGYFLWLLWTLLTEQAPTFSLDAPHLTWIYTAEVVVFGFIAAVAALRVRSFPRLLALVAFGAWVALFHYWQPRQAANLAVPTEWQMNVLKAAAWAGAWFLLMAVLSRLVGFRRRGGWSLAALIWPLGLVAMGGWAFGFYNYVQQDTGLWRSVVALDAEDGDILWQEGVGAPLGRKYPTNSYATPTPATNGDVVVANFGPVLLALDRDGTMLWQKEEPLFTSWGRHGAGASPVIHGDTVIHVFYPEIQEAGTQVPSWDHQEHSYIRALDLESGEELWRTGPIEGGHDAFTTPILLDVGDRTVALLSVMDHVQAFDADTGEHLWGYEEPMHVPVPSPVVGDGAVFTGGGLYGPTLITAISLDERGMAVDTKADGTVRSRWSKTRGTPEVSSPILYEGLLYWITQNGRMFAADPADGEIVWRVRLNAAVNASPAAAEGRLYVPSSDGKVLVLRAGREHEVLAENEFPEGFYASPAIAGGRIYLRSTENTVWAIGRAD